MTNLMDFLSPSCHARCRKLGETFGMDREKKVKSLERLKEKMKKTTAALKEAKKMALAMADPGQLQKGQEIRKKRRVWTEDPDYMKIKKKMDDLIVKRREEQTRMQKDGEDYLIALVKEMSKPGAFKKMIDTKASQMRQSVPCPLFDCFL